MRISFTKAHGTRNDFLLTWASEAPGENLEAVARAICDRHSGVGADGWILVSLTGEPLAGRLCASGAEALLHFERQHGQSRVTGEDSGCDAEIRLFNADGSHAEISGNGTRCAAAFLTEPGLVPSPVRIRTHAGLRELRLVSREGRLFWFEMDMGRPVWREEEVHFRLPLRHGEQEVTLLDTGNPQCAVFVKDHDFDWRALGAEIESHAHFPNRTNVSFVRVLDEHTLDVRFFERGAGETMSSGTGSTGAVWAASLQGLVQSPVSVLTPGGPLELRWDQSIFLTGPAEIVGRGEFYFG